MIHQINKEIRYSVKHKAQTKDYDLVNTIISHGMHVFHCFHGGIQGEIKRNKRMTIAKE